MSLKKFLAFLAISTAASQSSAEISLSQLIVDLSSNARARDVEIYNDSDERAFVVIEPREIINPGQISESTRKSPDPEALGLIVSPRKIILEPRQRRLIRLADIGADRQRERVYRVMVKPQVGQITSQSSGLKLLVGYDMLVLVRPDNAEEPSLAAKRVYGQLVITNNGNASVELDAGKQCDAREANCRDLGGKRLYAGASWTVDAPMTTPARFKVKTSSGWSNAAF